jgi:hypothetical protein
MEEVLEYVKVFKGSIFWLLTALFLSSCGGGSVDLAGVTSTAESDLVKTIADNSTASTSAFVLSVLTSD